MTFFLPAGSPPPEPPPPPRSPPYRLTVSHHPFSGTHIHALTHSHTHTHATHLTQITPIEPRSRHSGIPSIDNCPYRRKPDTRLPRQQRPSSYNSQATSYLSQQISPTFSANAVTIPSEGYSGQAGSLQLRLASPPRTRSLPIHTCDSFLIHPRRLTRCSLMGRNTPVKLASEGTESAAVNMLVCHLNPNQVTRNPPADSCRSSLATYQQEGKACQPVSSLPRSPKESRHSYRLRVRLKTTQQGRT